jgi:altronate dehydratase
MYMIRLKIMSQAHPFTEVARLAAPGDNVAIATRRLEPGLTTSFNQHEFTLASTVLEGHRFAIREINKNEALLSWGLPFGIASREIKAGQYVANESILETLRARNISVQLPDEANFVDAIKPYELDEANFKAAEQLPRYDLERSFEGFVRGGNRGVGTRNYIVLLATTSLTGGYVKELEVRFKDKLNAYKNIDGVVAVAHTEGGTKTRPNNYDLVLRTLAGFVTHPNVAAVLCVDRGHEVINNRVLESYLRDNKFPLESVTHKFLSLQQNFTESLAEREAIVQRWLEPVNKQKRETVSASHLKLALQCGGSDAFSGISANPLGAWVAKELIHYGGSANLAETDELIGAESYILQKVKSLEVAKKFLAMIERFKTRAAWHGTSAEGNPSGGNKLRGLYNIALKSIGAANKKHPDVRLDDVIDYGETMTAAGYYFMDSPGNDLESIAGQVASGCNMIFFTTGNGSITNFPFVPTIKMVTTSERFKLLENDMDVNAGAYLDGTGMDELGQETLELLFKVASGKKSIGEKAGHAQVQLWRNWQQTDSRHLAELLHSAEPSGQAIRLERLEPPEIHLEFLEQGGHVSSDQLGLILPTSLCSGQIAAMMAKRLTDKKLGFSKGITKFVSLTHTEGCGVSGGRTATMQTHTLLNYLRHPRVKHALLLEHGCEMTHNDHMRQVLQTLGMSAEQFGWASIQLDGGIEKVIQKVDAWFEGRIEGSSPPQKIVTNLHAARVGVYLSEQVSEKVGKLLATFIRTIVSGGGTVVLPELLLKQNEFTKHLRAVDRLEATLTYGQYAETSGLHVMQTPTEHWVEILTGLGATGVELVMAQVAEHPLQTHPFIPVVQLCSDERLFGRHADSLDVFLSPTISEVDLLKVMTSMFAKTQTPKLHFNSDFQMTRGYLGISM